MAGLRVNPFSLILFLMHKVSFCWTPIHTDRYVAQLEEEKRLIALSRGSRRTSKVNSCEIKLNLQQCHESNPTIGSRIHKDDNSDSYYSSDDDEDADKDVRNWNRATQTDNANLLPWGYFIFHPIQLLQLIKRYHLAGNYFLIGCLVHFAILIHLIVKSIIMIVAESPGFGADGGTGVDSRAPASRKVNEYYKSPLYPYMVGSFKEPYSMNNMILAMLICCLCSRLLSAFRLIRGSIINQKSYRRIWVTQINIVLLTFLWLKPAEWVTVLRQASHHSKGLKYGQEKEADEKDVQQLRDHLFLDETAACKLEKNSVRQLMYSENTIEFKRCYGDLHFIPSLERSKSHRDWFSTAHHYRVCIGVLRSALLFSVCGSLILINLSFIFLMAVLYLELISSMPSNTVAKTWSELAMNLMAHLQTNGIYNGLLDALTNSVKHFYDPVHLIRSIELYVFLLLNVPNYLDAVAIYADLVITNGRIDKLIRLLDFETKLSHHVGDTGSTNYSSLFEQTMFEVEPINRRASGRQLMNPLRASFKHKQRQFSKFNKLFGRSLKTNSLVPFVESQQSRRKPMEWSEIEVEKANNRVLRLIKLSNLLYYEFIDLRSRHSLYLNLLFVGNGISSSYMLTLMSIVRDPVQLLLIFLALLTSLLPILVILVFCAILERRVSVER